MAYDPNNRDPDLLPVMEDMEKEHAVLGAIVMQLEQIDELMASRLYKAARLRVSRLLGYATGQMLATAGAMDRLRQPED